MEQISSKQAMEYVNEASHTWDPKPYADALVSSGIYYPKDALAEANSVGAVMSKEFLTPFVVGEKGYDSFDNLDQAINKYNASKKSPSIYVLGSGNTGIPLILNTLIGVLAGQTVYLKSSRGNHEAIHTWLNHLKQMQDTQKGSICDKIIEVTGSYEDETFADTLSKLDIQKAYLWGGGEALINTKKMLPETVNSYLFGPRTGVVIFEYDWWKIQSGNTKEHYSQALYENLLVNDAALCSSPTRGIIIGSKDEADSLMNEIINFIKISPDETERLDREILSGASKRRQNMRTWRKFGISMYQPDESKVLFGLGTEESKKNLDKFVINQGNYHESAGNLDLYSFEKENLANAAQMIALLQNENRYQGLWSVGHLISAANTSTIDELLNHIKNIQDKSNLNSYTLKPEELRIVTLTENIGRTPGESFDGINLLKSMLE